MEERFWGAVGRGETAGPFDFRLAPPGSPTTLAGMLLTCQAGFESVLVRELADAGLVVSEHGPGWAVAPDLAAVSGLAFPHATMRGAVELKGESVNALAGRMIEFSREPARRARRGGLALRDGRAGGTRRAWAADERRRKGVSASSSRSGCRAWLSSRWRTCRAGRARRAVCLYGSRISGACLWRAKRSSHGQRRMADDDAAPSRSYLKVEEAFVVLGSEPQAGETVVDLGAAPGGWSYSAAKRGARVIAVDDGPLKGGALNNSLIEHRTGDAFHFNFEENTAYDWMLCDLLEEPHHVMKNLVEPWLARGWCKRFVFNLQVWPRRFRGAVARTARAGFAAVALCAGLPGAAPLSRPRGVYGRGQGEGTGLSGEIFIFFHLGHSGAAGC